MRSRGSIWLWIFIGSTIGGFIPELWGGDLFSYSGLLLSGVGAFFGLWVANTMA
jgi:hypothetical protein